MHCDMTRSTKNQPHTYKISTFASHLGGGQKKILNPEMETHQLLIISNECDGVSNEETHIVILLHSSIFCNTQWI